MRNESQKSKCKVTIKHSEYITAGEWVNCFTADTSFRDGGYFYYGQDKFFTSKSHPTRYVCAVGDYLCEGDSFVRDTGLITRGALGKVKPLPSSLPPPFFLSFLLETSQK